MLTHSLACSFHASGLWSHGRSPSNTHPCELNPLLTKRFTHLQKLGVATSTRRTYQAGVNSYLRFCIKHGIKPLPASQLTLQYFCTELSYSVSYATIRVYLAGIRLFHIENHFPDPTSDAPLLHYLCNGIHRCTRNKKKTKRMTQSITITLLHSIKLHLSQDSSLHPHNKL